jgi:UDP-N-acetylmuramate dehydrogenase
MQTLEKPKAIDLPAFCDAHGLEVFENVSLSKYSYLKTGGTARYVVYPRSVDSLVSMLGHMVEIGQRFKIIGNTSNLLFKDATDYSVLICTLWLNDISVANGELVAECGASLPELSRQALYAGFRGFEGLEGIPGTVGAGIFMNAGAYGSEIKDTLLAVDLADAGGSVRRHRRRTRP